jgi:hypothetical protein
MKQKKDVPKKTSTNNKKANSIKSVVILFFFSLLLATFYINNAEQKSFIDEEIALNIFEKNYLAGKYSEILINESKAIATQS